MRPKGGNLRAILGRLGASWGISGGSEKGLGEPWRRPGNILGTFSKDFLPS